MQPQHQSNDNEDRKDEFDHKFPGLPEADLGNTNRSPTPDLNHSGDDKNCDDSDFNDGRDLRLDFELDTTNRPTGAKRQGQHSRCTNGDMTSTKSDFRSSSNRNRCSKPLSPLPMGLFVKSSNDEPSNTDQSSRHHRSPSSSFATDHHVGLTLSYSRSGLDTNFSLPETKYHFHPTKVAQVSHANVIGQLTDENRNLAGPKRPSEDGNVQNEGIVQKYTMTPPLQYNKGKKVRFQLLATQELRPSTKSVLEVRGKPSWCIPCCGCVKIAELLASLKSKSVRKERQSDEEDIQLQTTLDGVVEDPRSQVSKELPGKPNSILAGSRISRLRSIQAERATPRFPSLQQTDKTAASPCMTDPHLRGGIGFHKVQTAVQRVKQGTIDKGKRVFAGLKYGLSQKPSLATGPISHTQSNEPLLMQETSAEPFPSYYPEAEIGESPGTGKSTRPSAEAPEKTKALQEVDLLPDILIWPIGISKWLQPVPSTPTNLIPIAEADHIGFSRRTHVISSFEDDENNVRLLLEERESRGLAGTNAFYFLLTSNSDLRFHINTKTGHVLRSPERIHNHCDRCNYDDYELMRSLTKTISTHRYWVLNVENISCLQCVEELQEKRRKAVCNRVAKVLRGESAGSYRCVSSYHIHCNHNTEVKRFFEGLSYEYAKYIQKLRLIMETEKSPNPDVAASAIDVVKKYLPALEEIRVEFPTKKDCGDIRDYKPVRGMVSCLKDLENHLPLQKRLDIQGLEHHPVLNNHWMTARRPWWVGVHERLSCRSIVGG